MKTVEIKLPIILELLEKGKKKEIKAELKELHPDDIASIIESLEDNEKTIIFRLLDTERASEVILLVSEYTRFLLISHMRTGKLTTLIEEMETDDAADIIQELPKNQVRQVLEKIDQEESEEVKKLLKHEEETAGGLMQTEFLSINSRALVKKAIAQVRKSGDKIKDLHNVFVTDDAGRLTGIVSLRRMVLARPTAKISKIMNPKVVSVRTGLDQEEVARIFEKHDLISMPVVDSARKPVGRITVDDIVDVIREEASEDMYRLAGLSNEEHPTDPVLLSVRRRLPWLLVNLATAILAASVVGLFQNTIQALVLLAVFMPIVAGMGGNAGTQTLTVVVRGIALGDVSYANARKVLKKEVTAGVINGIITGIVMAVIASFWGGNPLLGMVLGVAMVMNLFVATFTGTAVPLVLRWFKVDPALASSVIVTTFTDVFGFFSFLGLATLLLKYLI